MVRVNRDVVVVAVDRAGWRKGARVAEFVAWWNVAEAELGSSIGIESFAKWWPAGAVATAYRRQAEFREVFPEFDTPAGLSVQRGRLVRSSKRLTITAPSR